ncbi:SMKI16G0795 [Saccharomyces mikatae IFO 1815]|uniref:SMKI16G0795 protein n=1 Tax=Saccharomyces mikatae IFO 1815 TaxID=226126 RepID=A0AA35NG32_SACMI|nr:uncharacterized protein SMKI_16G0795 [Saccharomyces mikatae IFO 1815]CAI4036779.1 SMKI16G0795 [Saccharomyces mikatae IFO 1815]
MLKRSFNVVTCVSRSKLSSTKVVVCQYKSLLNNQQRYTSTSPRKEIKSLEDLVNLNSLDGVDTDLIRNLINERTTELNIKKELDMLKKFSQEEESGHDIPVKRFIRPLWMFVLMGSSVYLLLHFTWWKLEHDERENQLKNEVETLEDQLNELISQNKISHDAEKESTESVSTKRWYEKWFW